MNPAVLGEARVVPAPEPEDPVGFADDGGNHLRLVVRHVERNVKHDVGYQTAHGGNAVGLNVLQPESVGRVVGLVFLAHGPALGEGEGVPPVDGQHHDAV